MAIPLISRKVYLYLVRGVGLAFALGWFGFVLGLFGFVLGLFGFVLGLGSMDAYI